MLRFRSILGGWRKRGFAWKVGFSVGIILSGATMMAAYVGVPRPLHPGDGGSLSVASSNRIQLMNPSTCSTRGLERFQNVCALLSAVKGGIFLMKMPLSSGSSGAKQF